MSVLYCFKLSINKKKTFSFTGAILYNQYFTFNIRNFINIFVLVDSPWCPRPNLTYPSYIDDQRNDFFYEENVTLSCQDGFEILGSPGIICLADKTWTKMPQCTRMLSVIILHVPFYIQTVKIMSCVFYFN